VSTALVVGEALIDEFPDRRVVAGAPLHVAVHLASLGWDTAVITRVGADADGAEIVGTLERFGVDTSLVEQDDELPTGVTAITIDGTDHTFDVLPGAWDAINGPDPTPPADVICFGTLVLRDHRSRTALERMLDTTTAKVVVDLNLRAPDFDDERIRWAVTRADVLKLNEDELQIACGAFSVDQDPTALHELGPEWVCVTRGPEGAELTHEDGNRWSAPAPAVDVVDTVGAGDAFLATLIDGLEHDHDADTALTSAVRRGGEIASQRGGLPEPPTR
jgi:fructokinase